MSATHSWSGPSAEKSRFTRSRAALASASRFVVPVLRFGLTARVADRAALIDLHDSLPEFASP